MAKLSKSINSILNLRGYIIWIILFVGFTIRIAALYKYGLNLTLNSDDAGYTRSAMMLLEKKMLIYHDANTPTVHIMPGQPMLLAFVFFLFGTSSVGIYAAKFMMILFGLGSIYGIYLIGKYIYDEKAGLFSAFLFAIFIPQVLTDNLLLTESPFTALSVYLMYFSIRLANEQKMVHFYLVITLYLLSLYFRPTIALFPFILLVYLILKKYPVKLMVKQLVIAAGLLLVFLGPWWIRNYVQFNEFIPLTAGSGNPLLLGTYQGNIIPEESYQDVIDRIDQEHPNADIFVNMTEQANIAKEKIQEMWSRDKKAFIYSYAIIKPRIFWETQFYWIEIFNIKNEWIQKLNPYVLKVSALGFILSFAFFRNRWKESIFMLLFIGYFTLLNCIYFAYDRYNQPLMPFVIVYIGIVFSLLINIFFKLRKKFVR